MKKTKEQIYFNMSRIRSKNTQIELILGRALQDKGLKYRRHYNITGKPDFALVDKRIVVFCDSEFWHGYNWSQAKKEIKTNREFWIKKIEGNIKRDKEVNNALRKQGWKVIRFWGKQIKKDPECCAERVLNEYMKKEIIAIDIFCGAGGLTRGLLDAGIRVKKGFDVDPKLKDTYEKNNEGVKFFCKDIKELRKRDIADGLDIENNYLLLAGCAPCQPFSSINQDDIAKDERKSLLLEFGRLVQEVKPDFIFAENVPGLKNGRGKHIFNEFERILSEEGYFFVSGIVNAKNYGVPQNRRRLVLLASKYGTPVFPKEIYDGVRTPFITVRDAISKYPPIKAGEKHDGVPNHWSRGLSEKNLSRLRHIPKNGGGRRSLPKSLSLKCHRKHSGHSDVYGRMRWDAPAPTLTCKCVSLSNGRFGHPEQDRGISIREAAALQTFGDEYVFYGDLTNNTKWVGNAVPVKLAREVGKAFIKAAGGCYADAFFE